MTAIKERIIGALTVMSDDDAAHVWDMISSAFSSDPWNGIEETEATEEEKAVLARYAAGDPELQPVYTQKEVLAELGLENMPFE